MRPGEFVISVVRPEMSIFSRNFEITLTMRSCLNSLVFMWGLHARHDLLALLFVPDMTKHNLHKHSKFPNQMWRP
jgi:hypothetical protein